MHISDDAFELHVMSRHRIIILHNGRVMSEASSLCECGAIEAVNDC